MKKHNILNITSFYGVKDEVINNYIHYLNNLIKKKNLDDIQKNILSEYISKLSYYKIISNTKNPDFNKFIEYINKEYLYLKEKFPYLGIEFQGRIKSLISTDSKIKKDLKQALINGEELSSISLKDILAYRYILHIPENLNLNENETAQICYDFLKTQIDFNIKNGNTLLKAKHIDSTNIDSLKNKISEYNIQIPTIEFDDKYSDFVKNYIKNPKESLYQALHVRYMIGDIPFETQIKTNKMHNFAEYGAASHKYYKPRSSFNIHKVPQELGFIKTNSGFKIDFLPIDESIKLYYGYTFEDRFGVTFKEFKSNFSSKEQNLILKGKAKIKNGNVVTHKKQRTKQRIKKSDVTLSELLELSAHEK